MRIKYVAISKSGIIFLITIQKEGVISGLTPTPLIS